MLFKLEEIALYHISSYKTYTSKKRVHQLRSEKVHETVAILVSCYKCACVDRENKQCND